MNRVLVVETDECVGEILQGALSAAPDRLDPVMTGSGEEALRLLAREDFDIFLVDLSLPGIDDIEVLVRAKQLHPGMRSFAMSAAVSPELQAAVLDSGVAEILRKPLDLDALLETLATRPAANGSAPPAQQSPDGGGSAMENLTKLLDELAGEATDVLAAGIVRLSDGRSVIEGSRDPALASSIAACAAAVRGHLEAAELLGGSAALGDTEDLLFTMGKAFLLIRMLGPDHYLGLVLAKPANPGLARLLMRRFEPFFLDALSSGGAPTGGFM